MKKGEFYNVDINGGYERLAKAIVVGGVRDWDYAFLATGMCLDLCLMVDWDRDEIVRKLRVVEKREGPYWWRQRRTCIDCSRAIADWNKTGYCDSCAKKHNGKTYNYSKGRVCPMCGGRMSDNATLCRSCENKRRSDARSDGS